MRSASRDGRPTGRLPNRCSARADELGAHPIGVDPEGRAQVDEGERRFVIMIGEEPPLRLVRQDPVMADWHMRVLLVDIQRIFEHREHQPMFRGSSARRIELHRQGAVRIPVRVGRDSHVVDPVQLACQPRR